MKRRNAVKSNMRISAPMFKRLSTLNYVEPPVYQSLLSESLIDDNGKEVVFSVTDIFLLFNQERLSRTLGDDTCNKILDSFRKNVSLSGSDPYKGISDEDLINFIKSRHCQQQADVLAWSRYLESNYSYILEQIEQQKQDQQKQDQQKQDQQKQDQQTQEPPIDYSTGGSSNN